MPPKNPQEEKAEKARRELEAMGQDNVFGGNLLGGFTQRAVTEWQKKQNSNMDPQSDVSPRLRKIILILRIVFFTMFGLWILHSFSN